MSQHLIITIDADEAGLTWTAQQYDVEEVAIGSGITTNFTADSPNPGDYTWDYTLVDDACVLVTFLASNGREFLYDVSAGDTGSALPSDEDLITLAELKVFLGISGTTYDALLRQLITAASYTFIKYCEKTSFKLSTYSGTIMNGTGQRYLIFPDWPVTSITRVITGYNDYVPTTFAGSQFDLEGATGEARFKPTATFAGRIPGGFQNISTTYIAGLSTIPADLKLACKLFCKRLYQQTTVNTSLKSETIGDYKYENFQPLIAQHAAGFAADPMFDDIRTLLAAGGYYRSHVMLS